MNINEQKRWLLVFGLLTIIFTGLLFGPAMQAEWEYRSSDDRLVQCQAAKSAMEAWAGLDYTARAAAWEDRVAQSCRSRADRARELLPD